MTEKEANKHLKKIDSIFFNKPKEKLVNYAAVVKNPTKEGDFTIELGILMHNLTKINNLFNANKELFKEVNFTHFLIDLHLEMEPLSTSNLDKPKEIIGLLASFKEDNKLTYQDNKITETNKLINHLKQWEVNPDMTAMFYELESKNYPISELSFTEIQKSFKTVDLLTKDTNFDEIAKELDQKQDKALFDNIKKIKNLSKTIDFLNLNQIIEQQKIKTASFTSLFYTIDSFNWKENIDNNAITLVASSSISPQSVGKSIKRYTPLTGGVSISVASRNAKTPLSGTAGALFKMQGIRETFMISNEHVMICKLGDTLTQPSRQDAIALNLNPIKNEIAKLYWKSSTNMDAAIAIISEDIVIDQNRKTRCNGLKLNTIADPKIDMQVRKCGRTTGLTASYIRSINCTVNLGRTHENSPFKIYKNQILTTNMSKKGDSGSVLVNDNDDVVGLLIGGSCGETFYNNINIVLKKAFPNNKFKEFV